MALTILGMDRKREEGCNSIYTGLARKIYMRMHMHMWPSSNGDLNVAQLHALDRAEHR
jgi:hypothetical protein